jgi:phosphoribosylformylglycinamidine (FGAM) synthase-like enzyme
MKPKDPTNYLLKDLPDFNRITTAFEYLEKRKPTLAEIKLYQAIWTKHKQMTATTQ